jgi:hypothetical protein
LNEGQAAEDERFAQLLAALEADDGEPPFSDSDGEAAGSEG